MINMGQFIYPYGKFYNYEKENFPEGGEYDLLVYVNFKRESRAIGSLEGVFVSCKNLSYGGLNPCINRNEMSDFEKTHSGKFLKFKE